MSRSIRKQEIIGLIKMAWQYVLDLSFNLKRGSFWAYNKNASKAMYVVKDNDMLTFILLHINNSVQPSAYLPNP